MKKRVVAVVVAALLIVCAVVAVAYRETRIWLGSPLDSLNESVIYEVPQGATLNGVLKDLQNRAVLDHPRVLSWWVRFARPGYRLKAGEYELHAKMTPIEIVELFTSGHVVLHSLTVVEGTTFAEFERALAANPAIRLGSPHMQARELMQRLGADVAHPEGLFFPDTYRFPKGATDLDVYTMAYRRMQSEVDQAWSTREAGLPFASAYEALIMASIVEKETALGTERPQIAGVFIERLRKGMRLQTDPTVIYGIGEAYDGNIHKADLLRDTPYNTYTRVGLPPTPICLPGHDSLQATLHPQITGALFFVATGKGDGSHHFSKTLEEHNAAVQRYLKTLR